MQNAYAVERLVQMHDAHARAEAEFQALRRQAMAARRRDVSVAWRLRLSRLMRPGRVPEHRAGRPVQDGVVQPPSVRGTAGATLAGAAR